ncbi:TPA: hypothetical protein ACH3X2_007422 [Trebouxia sp. C0005]
MTGFCMCASTVEISCHVQLSFQSTVVCAGVWQVQLQHRVGSHGMQIASASDNAAETGNQTADPEIAVSAQSQARPASQSVADMQLPQLPATQTCVRNARLAVSATADDSALGCPSLQPHQPLVPACMVPFNSLAGPGSAQLHDNCSHTAAAAIAIVSATVSKGTTGCAMQLPTPMQGLTMQQEAFNTMAFPSPNVSEAVDACSPASQQEALHCTEGSLGAKAAELAHNSMLSPSAAGDQGGADAAGLHSAE